MNTQIIGLITPIMAVVFIAVFGLLWWRGRMGDHVLAFAAAYAFFAVGFVVTHVFDETSPILFHVTQVFYTGGTISLIWGATSRVNRAISLPLLGTIYAISAVTLAIAVAASNDISPRLYIVNTGYGVMFTIGTLTLLQSRRREFFDRLVIAIFALSAINFLCRPVLVLLIEQNIPVGDYRDSVYYSILNLTLAIMSLLTAVTLIGVCVTDLVNSIKERSDRDLLTGLRNRRAFEGDIGQMLDRASNAGVPVGLVVADIDHFKQVNDLWGHQAGDHAIETFGKLIESMVRSGDVTGRIGGEEFCIAVWDCDLDETHRLAERLRIAFAQLQHEGISDAIRLTASFGAVEWSGKETYHRLFGRADQLLYDAKQDGRNRVASDRRHQPEVRVSSPDQHELDLPISKAG